MTFKHIKFDSEVFRSLEKVAVAKGLVKPETLEKKASITKKADYTPSSDFMENILKLCAGLRTEGLVKEAAELEVNFLNYKQAQTLYETSKEKGEDLVQSAHPKGSHKLEGVDAEEATFEDILDQHLKSVQMVEKKPTGKLTNASQLIQEVKRALGQTDSPAQISALMGKVRSLAQRVVNLTESELTASWSHVASSLDKLAQNPTVDNLKRMQELINTQKWRLKPGLAFGLSEDTWTRVRGALDEMSTSVSMAIELRTKINEQAGMQLVESAPAAPPKAEPGSDMFKKINGAASQFAALANQITSDDPKDAAALEQTKNWLKQKSVALQNLAKQFQSESDKEAVMNVYQATLNKYMAALQKTQQEWS
jgi:hypothetical protein